MLGGQQVVATRDSLLQAEGHTKTGSHALRVYEGGDFPTYLREGEALVTMLEAQRCVRRSVFFRSQRWADDAPFDAKVHARAEPYTFLANAGFEHWR